MNSSVCFMVLSVFVVLANGSEVQTHLGHVKLHAKIGNVGKKYHPLLPDDVKASRNAAETVESLRKSFSTGVGHLPALDPYRRAHIQPINFGSSDSWLTGTVKLKNISIFGAQKFTLNDMQIRTKNNRTDFNISFPQLYAECEYEAEVYSALYFGFIPFTFSGRARAIAYNVNISGAVRAARRPYRTRQVFNLVAVDAKATLDDIQVILSDTPLGDFLRNLEQQNVLSRLFDSVKGDIAHAAAKIALEQANEILKHYTTEKVLKHLLSK